MRKGRTFVVSGPSGVGKSTLINALAPDLARETGEISRKLGRGRYTPAGAYQPPQDRSW